MIIRCYTIQCGQIFAHLLSIIFLPLVSGNRWPATPIMPCGFGRLTASDFKLSATPEATRPTNFGRYPPWCWSGTNCQLTPLNLSGGVEFGGNRGTKFVRGADDIGKRKAILPKSY
jgi:hypothetical protein